VHPEAPPALQEVQVVAVAPFLKKPSAHSEHPVLVHDLQLALQEEHEVIGDPVANELSEQPEQVAARVASPALQVLQLVRMDEQRTHFPLLTTQLVPAHLEQTPAAS